MSSTAQLLADLDRALEQALAADDAAGAARIRRRLAYYESDGMPNAADLITTAQAAKLRGDVTDHTVRRWCRLGWLKASKYGKTWLMPRDAALEFVPPPSGPKAS